MRFSVAECLHAPLETAKDQTAVAWRGRMKMAAVYQLFPGPGRFDDALELDPADGPSRVYLVRSHERMDMPPAAPWDGVYELTAKWGDDCARRAIRSDD